MGAKLLGWRYCDAMDSREIRVLDIDRFVPALVTFLANRLTATGSASFRSQLDMNILDFRILAMLAIEPGIPASRIVQVIGLDKALVSRTLAALGRRGWVRSEKDPTHGRRRLVSLTEAGMRMHDRALALALEREALLLEPLETDEREQLVTLLHKMLARTEAVAKACV
ncbi:MarR family winged helix-turn-helix transcriptional regulator [Sphingosinicella rhizophila]|uniref:MarR family transcriptional regulator n=1 Tax=Sphingosinicella rhizophila TaxID=3050082 RepID=A0ABU3Q3Y6_9SPHN|nr:MarR family transcriptional regulator [Sphingosinicella sp. GR2756]MDT9598128.1 MarR family transcriptional regulator [Sphingosinicella sp. GR2756]